MRMLLSLVAPLLLGGCITLDAAPMQFSCGELLARYAQTYQPTPLFAEIQRDAGQDDPAPGTAALTTLAARSAAPLDASDPLLRALAAASPGDASPEAGLRAAPRPAASLLLSGGGSWGAFGAGFLQQYGRTDWATVSGISTGALQGLMVAAGDYDALVREYSIQAESELASKNSIFGIVRKGALYDTHKLGDRVLAYLRGTGGDSPFARIAHPDSPALVIGMVKADTGDLRVVAITDMVRSVYTADGAAPAPEAVERLAQCVAGITLASASIPVQLSPVQIDGDTYFDGGVRSSVFETGVAQRHAADAQRPGAPPAELYVIRNGPTVVFRDAPAPGSDIAQVDARPDAARVGLRAYATIVNQNELMSIAALRLTYPDGPIRLVTADGFNSPANPDRCGMRPETAFAPDFMKCLIRWGKAKASPAPDWIVLGDVAVPPPAPPR